MNKKLINLMTKEIIKHDFKKIVITAKDLAFIDKFCDNMNIPRGEGFRINYTIFLNAYKLDAK